MNTISPLLQWSIVHVALVGISALCGCSDELPEPSVEVTAEQLVDEYEENEVGADARYDDKVVRIKGKVKSIDKGPLGGLSVTLKASLLFGGNVVCEFPKSQTEALAKLRPGDNVTVVGRVTGRVLNSGRDVNVENCRIAP